MVLYYISTQHLKYMICTLEKDLEDNLKAELRLVCINCSFYIHLCFKLFPIIHVLGRLQKKVYKNRIPRKLKVSYTTNPNLHL